MNGNSQSLENTLNQPRDRNWLPTRQMPLTECLNLYSDSLPPNSLSCFRLGLLPQNLRTKELFPVAVLPTTATRQVSSTSKSSWETNISKSVPKSNVTKNMWGTTKKKMHHNHFKSILLQHQPLKGANDFHHHWRVSQVASDKSCPKHCAATGFAVVAGTCRLSARGKCGFDIIWPRNLNVG